MTATLADVGASGRRDGISSRREFATNLTFRASMTWCLADKDASEVLTLLGPDFRTYLLRAKSPVRAGRHCYRMQAIRLAG